MQGFLMDGKYLIILNIKLSMQIMLRLVIRIIQNSISNNHSLMKKNILGIINKWIKVK